MSKGPAMKPLCELSLIVAVSSGPGIIAPEKAMIKEDTKIVISSHTVYVRPVMKRHRELKLPYYRHPLCKMQESNHRGK
jgi:hypothetical protein